MGKEKNMTLELIKLFAAYMVVFIHVMFQGEFGVLVDALARFAVPLFFWVSGFFSYGISTEKIKNRIKHILFLIVFSVAAYTAFNLFRLAYYGGISYVFGYFKRYLSLKALVELVVFNLPISSAHLWYLFSALYVYLLYYFAVKQHLREKIVYIISGCLLILHLILGEVLSVFGIVTPMLIVRNFALMGVPFFALGLFTKKYGDRLKKVKIYQLAIIMAIGIVGTVFSRRKFGENELYVGSLAVLFVMICVILRFKNAQIPAFFQKLSSCSTYIYIFHIMVSDVIYMGYSFLGINNTEVAILNAGHPIIVCFATTVFALVLNEIMDKIFKKKPIKKKTE